MDMGRGKWILACIGVALLAWPVGAAEKGNNAPVVTGQNTGQSISVTDGSYWRTLTGTSGGLNVANQPQGVLYYYPTVIQSVAVWPAHAPSGKTAQVDSTIALPALGATRWEMWIFPTFDDSTYAAVFALQVRKHRIESNDSLATYAWQPQIGASTTAGRQDTLGTVTWPTSVPVDSILTQTEIPVVVSSPSPTTGSFVPRGRAIPIRVNGTDVGNCDYISIRLRFLAELNSSRVPYGTLTLQTMSYKVTLVGYR